MHLLKTENDKKCSFFTKQKSRTGENLFSSKYKVVKSRKHHTISGRSLKVPYYMKFWRHFNLAIFLKIYK